MLIRLLTNRTLSIFQHENGSLRLELSLKNSYLYTWILSRFLALGSPDTWSYLLT
jgi:hypothetical protein